MNHRRFFFLLAVTCAPLFGACVYSVHPLDSGSDSISEPRLVGTWTVFDEGKESGQVTIRQGTQNRYELVGKDPDSGRTSIYELYLVKIAEDLFADVPFNPEQEEGEIKNPPAGAKTFHYFYRISIDGDTMKLAALSRDWLEDQIRVKQVTISHKEANEFTTVLTASPSQLQGFLKQLAHSDGAFTEGIELHRIK
jgi:hypothetical protein